MKLTKSKLKQIIKEELQAVLKEMDWATAATATDPEALNRCDDLDNYITAAEEERYRSGVEARLSFTDAQIYKLEKAKEEFKKLKCAKKIKYSQKMGVEPSRTRKWLGAQPGTKRDKAIKKYGND